MKLISDVASTRKRPDGREECLTPESQAIVNPQGDPTLKKCRNDYHDVVFMLINDMLINAAKLNPNLFMAKYVNDIEIGAFTWKDKLLKNTFTKIVVTMTVLFSIPVVSFAKTSDLVTAILSTSFQYPICNEEDQKHPSKRCCGKNRRSMSAVDAYLHGTIGL